MMEGGEKRTHEASRFSGTSQNSRTNEPLNSLNGPDIIAALSSSWGSTFCAIFSLSYVWTLMFEVEGIGER